MDFSWNFFSIWKNILKKGFFPLEFFSILFPEKHPRAVIKGEKNKRTIYTWFACIDFFLQGNNEWKSNVQKNWEQISRKREFFVSVSLIHVVNDFPVLRSFSVAMIVTLKSKDTKRVLNFRINLQQSLRLRSLGRVGKNLNKNLCDQCGTW